VTGIRDLARHLDISIGTVSRALNGKSDVNPQTRQRVFEAAAKLGYSPNQSGRSLRRGRTDLVGVIIPTGSNNALINAVFLSVLDGLRKRLSERRLDLAIFLHGQDEEPFGSLRRLTERGLVDGVIIANTLHVDPRIDYLIEKRRPFVAFGRSLSGRDHAWVDPDFEGAVEGAVDHLASHGHRRIALLLPQRETNFLYIIRDAFLSAMKRRGLALEPDRVLWRPDGEQGGYGAGEALLALDPRPTAVVVTDAMQTVGLYRILNDRGLRPGRDLSVVGVLPEASAQALSPALTAFQTDWTAIGVRLGDALIAAMGQGANLRLKPRAAPNPALRPSQPVQFIMPTALREGESVHRPHREAAASARRAAAPR
jgi:DNA-binding LacI/PurR family transcriptional regulator